MIDILTNVVCVMLGAFIAGFFQLRTTSQTVNQDVLLERTKMYKKLYFMFVLKYNKKYWMSFSGFFQDFYTQLIKDKSEEYLLLDPVSKKYMKNIDSYFKRVQRTKKAGKLQLFFIKHNLKKLRVSLDKEFMVIQSKRGYPIRRGKYFAVNFCMFIELLILSLLLSIENLYALVPNQEISSAITLVLIVSFFINSIYLYKTKGYLDIY